MSWIRFVAGCVIVVVVAVFTAVQFGNQQVRELNARVDELRIEKQKLIDYAQRLSATHRVAQIDVVSQRTDEQGRVVSNLLWQEFGPNGEVSRPVAVESIGKLVYVEALVLKFAMKHVGEGDAERGTSLALFRRIFGEDQAASTAVEFDRHARPPIDDPRRVNAERDRLWSQFWEFVDNPQLAEKLGIRVAQVEAPAVPMSVGQVWEVSLDAAGGLNLKRLPIDRRTASAPAVSSIP